METIGCRNLTFRYPMTDKYALDDITFSVEESSFTVICGKSGCGKSTLLRHLKKNLTPYGEREGRTYYKGEDIFELDDRINASKIGFVQQNPDNQIVTDKVWHEMAFGLESLGYDNGTIRRRTAEMANFFDIQSWFRKSVTDLSGGQKQILNLASIMVMQPDVLILDEPTSQLDPIAASEFIRTLYRINRELGTTVIISEHRLEELFPMADTVIVMDEGRITHMDSPENVGALLSEDNHPMFYGLPSVIKIFSGTGNRGKSPMNIRDGRLWLNDVLRGKKIESEETLESVIESSYPVISAKDVYFRYDRKSGDVLRNLQVEVQRGEWYCILGGNGSGKSTVLKALMGINKVTRGTIDVRGRAAMVPQNPQALFTEITVEEEMLEALEYTKYSIEEKAGRVRKMTALMELEGLEKNHPYDLSGGEQQRLAIGKIMLLEPDILIMDEPTKGLDPFFKRQLAKILKELKDKGTTVFMVSHDIEFCAENADRCAMLFDGGIVCCDNPHKFFSGNSFYTTAANQMAGKWFPEKITWEEVAQCVMDLI